MSLFKKLSEMIEGYTLNLSIRKEHNKIIVMVVPKIDSLESISTEIIPLVISGSPEELDTSFIENLGIGMAKLNNLQSNVEEFVDSIDKASKSGKIKGKKTKEPVQKVVNTDLTKDEVNPIQIAEEEKINERLTSPELPADDMPLDNGISPFIADSATNKEVVQQSLGNNSISQNDEENW
jgi:PRTRC genetic system protein E